MFSNNIVHKGMFDGVEFPTYGNHIATQDFRFQILDAQLKGVEAADLREGHMAPVFPPTESSCDTLRTFPSAEVFWLSLLFLAHSHCAP